MEEKTFLNIAKTPFVSIIVCARNEEKNITALLEALISQDYEKKHQEIIIANDESNDSTEAILKEYSKNYTYIKYFAVKDREKVKSPKKNAIKQAINISKGDIILLTDADCIPTTNWIKSHILMYEKYPEVEMVMGFSKTKLPSFKTASICQQFEHIDFLVLMTAARGAIQAGIPLSCSGQNLSYKKESFLQVGGFDSIDRYLSGDDVLLMQKFVIKKKIVKFAAFRDAYTETMAIDVNYSPPTHSPRGWWSPSSIRREAIQWKLLLNQRARWASNSKAMFKMNHAFFLYLLSCFFCLGLMPFGNIFFYLVIILFNAFFFRKAGLELGVSHILKWSIITPFYILIVTFLGMFSIFKWKTRSEKNYGIYNF